MNRKNTATSFYTSADGTSDVEEDYGYNSGERIFDSRGGKYYSKRPIKKKTNVIFSMRNLYISLILMVAAFVYRSYRRKVTFGKEFSLDNYASTLKLTTKLPPAFLSIESLSVGQYTPSETVKDRVYYASLGIENAATMGDVKRAYYKLAFENHPKINPKIPKETMDKLYEAYVFLSHPTMRKDYDSNGTLSPLTIRKPPLIPIALFGSDDLKQFIGNSPILEKMEAFSKTTDLKGNMVDFSKSICKDLINPQSPRAGTLALILRERVNRYLGDEKNWKSLLEKEISNIRKLPGGKEMLNAVGTAYVDAANLYLTATQSYGGLGGLLPDLNGIFTSMKDTIKLISAAYSYFQQVADKNVMDLEKADEKFLSAAQIDAADIAKRAAIFVCKDTTGGRNEIVKRVSMILSIGNTLKETQE